MTPAKRHLLSKGKGYMNAAGPQARFSLFLFGVLIAYTFILLLFRKMAEMLQLPLFLPIALALLILFISIVGAVYSHKYYGPLARFRRTIDSLAEGDNTVNLRVREHDDPLLKDLATSLSHLCDHARNQNERIQSAVKELRDEIESLRTIIERGADKSEVQTRFQNVREKQATLEHTVRLSKKG